MLVAPENHSGWAGISFFKTARQWAKQWAGGISAAKFVRVSSSQGRRLALAGKPPSI